MINPRILLIGLAVAVWTAGYAADGPQGASEEAVQSVLKKYGVSSTVLRSKSVLRDVPPPGGKGFPIELEGQPGIRVALDLDYWALLSAGKGNTPVSYMLNPKDGQSALVIAIGEGKSPISDDALTKEPGFTAFHTHPGNIGDEKVVWRSWSDANHLYSDCTAHLSAVGAQDAKKYSVVLNVTANTPERRKALEDHLQSLQLVFNSAPEEKSPANPKNNLTWLDPLIPEVSFKAEGWWGTLQKLAQLHDAQGGIIPVQIYTLSEPDEQKAINLSARNQSVRSILQDACRQFEVTFSVYQGIAVVGTPAELHRFDAAFSAQVPVTWSFGSAKFPRILLLNATAHETAAFFNKKFGEEHLAENPIRCVGHKNHPVTFNGYDITVSTLLAVIAADVGVPVSEVFVEQR